jgi:hypothetical protein
LIFFIPSLALGSEVGKDFPREIYQRKRGEIKMKEFYIPRHRRAYGNYGLISDAHKDNELEKNNRIVDEFINTIEDDITKLLNSYLRENTIQTLGIQNAPSPELNYCVDDAGFYKFCSFNYLGHPNQINKCKKCNYSQKSKVLTNGWLKHSPLGHNIRNEIRSVIREIKRSFEKNG